ncbi:MAG: hypothetical protein CL470_08750 [Acidimicrobiaceae bacterium]|nr:hypothetical protein [Acidimicrobiaceae bacterium]
MSTCKICEVIIQVLFIVTNIIQAAQSKFCWHSILESTDTIKAMQENDDQEEHRAKDIVRPRESTVDLPPADRIFTAPSRPIQIFSFAAILVGGLCGGLIGYAFTDLQCSESCTNLAGISAVVGALIGAGGVGVVSILVLRAMTEWRTNKKRSR